MRDYQSQKIPALVIVILMGVAAVLSILQWVLGWFV
jgi:hypothetical protein